MPKIMKGTEKFLFHRLLKPNFVGDLMIKDLYKYCGHPNHHLFVPASLSCPERTSEQSIPITPLVRGGRRMMCFVINDRIKIVR